MIRWGLMVAALSLPCAFAAACGHNGSTPGSGSKGSSSGGGTGDTQGDAGIGMTMVGQVDGGITGLPTLPTLTNVVATEREDSVGIDFDPFDNAIDYRVYPLPDPSDVSANADGSITIKNAIYRCAGLRQTNDLPNNTINPLNGPYDAGQVYENFNPQYSWTAQIPENPTLGYVYVNPGAGLVPVYAVGEHPSAVEVGWRESRPKIYTTDATLRASLLSTGGRDDGIVFYVPSTASTTTETIYHSETVGSVGENFIQYAEYYFTSADLSTHMSDTTPAAPAFQILSAAAPGTQPLMAVFYQAGENHTELAVGNERFKRASNQGSGPLWHLEWSGITAPTTLVVEALAAGCPFQGFLSPQSLDSPPHQPLLTLAQIQSASPTGEVFINGQYDLPNTAYTILLGNGANDITWGMSDADAPMLQITNTSPIPIARSFVQVAPQPHDPTAWDWYQGFNVGSDFGTVTETPDPGSCGCEDSGATPPCNDGNGACGYWTSPIFDMGGYELDMQSTHALFANGQFLGEFWDVLDDVAQDVTGTARYTATQTTNFSSDPNQYLHITWTVNTAGTDRRYPQLIVSDQPSPIEQSFKNPNSNTLLIQTRFGPSAHLEVEAFHGLVDGQPWQVNNQSTPHDLINYDSWAVNGGNPTAATGAQQPIPPADSPLEHAGMDRMTKYDAYISAGQLYVFMDGAAAGCTLWPDNSFVLSGALTVTFGDVIYHEAAPDEQICTQSKPYPFSHEHECTETKRHWDDLAFKSGVPAPPWDSTNFPCLPF